MGSKARLTTQDIIDRCVATHGNRYDYSELVYTTYNANVIIGCPICGIRFSQRVSNHIGGLGCKMCNNKRRIENHPNRLTQADIVRRSNEIHNNKYTYNFPIPYKNNRQFIEITCPIHGMFTQSVTNHLVGSGCTDCATEEAGIRYTKSQADFVRDARNVHGDKYDYSESVYKGARPYVTIICPIHGSFLQSPDVHTNRKCGCPHCNIGTDNPEYELYDLVHSLYPDAVQHDRKLIKPKELDIVIPSIKVAVEYCGLYWHSNAHGHKTPQYHKNKMKACNKLGYRLITIFEDEWANNKDVVKQKLSQILGHTDLPPINARQCTISPIDHSTQQHFLNEHHIQGAGPCSIQYGLFNNEELVGVMTFKVRSPGNIELVRYATSARVRGGFTKMLTHFTRKEEWTKIITFLDLRWGDPNSNIYHLAGFKLDAILPPDYRYVVGLVRVHKFNYRHKFLKDKLKNYDPSLSETENTRNNGIYKIYDCGLCRYVLTNNNNN